MLLRTYLTSTPVLEGTRLRFAVSVTDEMFMSTGWVELGVAGWECINLRGTV